MRIQNNIMAMNAYRNYTSNTSALSKNLEKLSSGYAINRAGDDAAGLAISEKMRAQITGLEGAQKNAKDGISLVQTAEGALTEVHDMLNRMYSLAEQSANGTYEDETDRAQLQKEVTALKSEIDRIADSANFNGINLLDGSLADGGKVGGTGSAAGAVDLNTRLGLSELVVKDVAATKGTYTMVAFGAGDIKNGESMDLTFSLNDGTNVTVTVFAKDNANGTGGKLIGADGTEYGTYAAGGSTGPTAAEMGKAMTEALKATDLGKNFDITDDGNGAVTLTNKVAGADAPQVLKDVNKVIKNADGTMKGTEATISLTATKGTDAYQTIDADQLVEYNGNDNTVLEINGKKFAILVQDGTTATDGLMKKAQENGIEVIMVADVNATTAANKGDGALHLDAWDAGTAGDSDEKAAAKAQGDTIAAALGKALGYNVTFVEARDDGTGGGTNNVGALFAFKKDLTVTPGAKEGTGLTLQIGDTGEDFNQLTVSINDCHADALGIGDLDIGTQSGAQAALKTIEDAINYVSDVRGGLGATQNRLDHTINNLSVMQENIQDAESSIRDTDVAEEMMAYTKNNILIQSAQAMLAQANQVPQGVLQLLQ